MPVAQRIVTPWMKERGYTLETPMEVMNPGAEVSEVIAGQIEARSLGYGAPLELDYLMAAPPRTPQPEEAGIGLLPIIGGVIGGLLGGEAGGVIGGLFGEAGEAIGGVAGEVLAAPGTREAVGHEAWVNGVPTGGPGVPEPPKWMIAKAWNVKVDSNEYGTFRMYYFRLTDGRCMSYHSPTKTWKIWKPKKHIVISKDPRVSTLRKLGRLNKRVEKMLRPFQPKKTGFPAKALARTYLSTAERKMLKGGA